MSGTHWRSGMVGGGVLGLIVFSAAYSPHASDVLAEPRAAGDAPEQVLFHQPAPRKPEEIWPAGLQKMVGRFTFVQVASPGGLWQSFMPAGGARPPARRQVSIHELPAPLRDKLQKGEIVISDLQLPTHVEAAERESPAKRGMLRFYEESAIGRLVLRNLPGVGSQVNDSGNYSGRVLFEIGHQSHSNPSISGILNQRVHEERTWGAATLDNAYLHATQVDAAGKEPSRENAPIANARILRSAVEIFAYVEANYKDRTGTRSITGCVRLMRR